jgi:hypothetical protein
MKLRELTGRFGTPARIARFFCSVIPTNVARTDGNQGIYCLKVPVAGVFACAGAQNLSVHKPIFVLADNRSAQRPRQSARGEYANSQSNGAQHEQ